MLKAGKSCILGSSMAYSDYQPDFEDIRPYTDEEMRPVLRRIRKNDWLVSGIRNVMFPRCPSFLESLVEHIVKIDLWNRLRKIKTIDQFQVKIIIGQVMEYIVRKTMAKVTTSGFDEYIHPTKPYLFISNHRDIVLDSAMVNYNLIKSRKVTAEIAFGDNLMVNEFVSDLIRINRSFIVQRQGPLRQRALAALTLSRYISYTLGQGHSVWLAQREGRAKDGDDRTNPSVIKMLYLGPKREKVSFDEFVNGANIVPVSVSYELDPCDVLKAREMHRRERAGGTYSKRKDEDLLSMYAGLSGWKGRVHLSYGEPISGSFSSPTEVAEKIDSEIHKSYHLWPSNYIAYDQLTGRNDNFGHYTEDERVSFLDRFRRESAEVKALALKIYANAVINKLSESPA